MWILDLVNKAGRQFRFNLVFGGDYTIGRKGCDINIEDADVSISRLHCKITVLSVPAGNLSDVCFVPEIYLSDCSKHGTYVNDGEVFAIEASRHLRPGDRIRFGKHATATVTYSPIVVSMSSHLSANQQKEIVDATGKIGGILSDPLIPSELHESKVSPFLFVFCTNEVSGEPCALQAMMCGYVLVSPEYVPDLFTVMRDSCRLPLQSLPQPGNFDAMRSPLLADRPYHRPEPSFYNKNEFLYSAPRTPQSIFRMMHTIFLEQSLFHEYEEVLHLGGGISTHVLPETVLDWEITDEELPLLGLVDVTRSHGLNALFVVGKKTFQIVLEVILGNSATIDPALIDNRIKALVKLWDLGFKLMHEENLHVAIYCADTAAQIADNAPGILLKSEMLELIGVNEDSDNDSEATEDGYSPSRLNNSSPGSPLGATARSLAATGSAPGEMSSRASSVSNFNATQNSNAAAAGGDQKRIIISVPQQLVSSPARSEDRAGSSSRSPNRGQRGASPNGVSAMSPYEEFKAAQRAQKEKEMLSGATGVPPSPKKHSTAPKRYVLTQNSPARMVAPSSATLTKSPLRGRLSPRIGYQTTADNVVSMCQNFATQTLNVVSSKVENECRYSIKQKYMSNPTRQYLEAVAVRFENFRINLDQAENEMKADGKHLKPSELVVVEEVRDRCETVFGAIVATFQSLAVDLTLPI